jgi:hypothetical protein
MWSSVAPAVPWIVRHKLPLITAALCSDKELVTVPGAPIRSTARSERGESFQAGGGVSPWICCNASH